MLLSLWTVALMVRSLSDARVFLFILHAFCTQFTASLAAAKNIVITVGGNETSGDPTTVFSPQRVSAELGDIVVFNCKP